MNKKEYFEVITSCLEIAKQVEIDRLEESCTNTEYQEGVIRGLQIACEKLRRSKFLAEAK